jgi:hypothetical protein
MPVYEFVSQDGRTRAERFYEYAKAPTIGSWRRFGGRRWRRVPSWGSATLAPRPDYAHVAHSIAGFHPDAPHHVGPLGKAAFENAAQIRQFAAKTGMTYDGLTNDAGGKHDAPDKLTQYQDRTREIKARMAKLRELKYHMEQQG